jgi:hypothetical protein
MHAMAVDFHIPEDPPLIRILLFVSENGLKVILFLEVIQSNEFHQASNIRDVE